MLLLILSNGFKLRKYDKTYDYWNDPGAMTRHTAFADQPFKFSNAALGDNNALETYLKTIRLGKSWIADDGTQHPATWSRWSDDDKKSKD